MIEQEVIATLQEKGPGKFDSANLRAMFPGYTAKLVGKVLSTLAGQFIGDPRHENVGITIKKIARKSDGPMWEVEAWKIHEPVRGLGQESKSVLEDRVRALELKVTALLNNPVRVIDSVEQMYPGQVIRTGFKGSGLRLVIQPKGRDFVCYHNESRGKEVVSFAGELALWEWVRRFGSDYGIRVRIQPQKEGA